MDFEQLLLESFINKGVITQEQFDEMVAEKRKVSPIAQLQESTATMQPYVERVKTASEIYDEQKDKTDILLEDLKQLKIAQLDHQCTQTILGRFKATVDGVEYEFSYDHEAQLRFVGTKALLDDGTITQIEWTAYLNGERVRIILNNTNFSSVQVPALNHQNSNVIKYNELLQQVLLAENHADVNSIVW